MTIPRERTKVWLLHINKYHGCVSTSYFHTFLPQMDTAPGFHGLLYRHIYVSYFPWWDPVLWRVLLLSCQWQAKRHASCLCRACKYSVTAVRISAHRLCLMWHTPQTSMEKLCVSVRGGAGPFMGRPAWARVGESLRVSGILLWAYIAQLFLTAHPLLITAFPPWTTQEARLAPFPARTRPDSNRIKEWYHWGSPSPFWKKRAGGGGQRNVRQKRLARANGVTFKELAPDLLRFQKPSNKQRGEQTFIPAEKHSTKYLQCIYISKEMLSFTVADNCHQTELPVT